MKIKPINELSRKEIEDIKKEAKASMPIGYIRNRLAGAIDFTRGFFVRAMQIGGKPEKKGTPVYLTSKQLRGLATDLIDDISLATRGIVTKHFYEVMFLNEFRWAHISYDELREEMLKTHWAYKFED